MTSCQTGILRQLFCSLAIFVTSSCVDIGVRDIAFSEFLAKVDAHKVQRVSIKGAMYEGVLIDTNERFKTIGPGPDRVLVDRLAASGAEVTLVIDDSEFAPWVLIVERGFPWLLVLLLLLWRRKPPSRPPHGRL
jgi:hypothetical protein